MTLAPISSRENLPLSGLPHHRIRPFSPPRKLRPEIFMDQLHRAIDTGDVCLLRVTLLDRNVNHLNEKTWIALIEKATVKSHLLAKTLLDKSPLGVNHEKLYAACYRIIARENQRKTFMAFKPFPYLVKIFSEGSFGLRAFLVKCVPNILLQEHLKRPFLRNSLKILIQSLNPFTLSCFIAKIYPTQPRKIPSLLELINQMQIGIFQTSKELQILWLSYLKNIRTCPSVLQNLLFGNKPLQLDQRVINTTVVYIVRARFRNTDARKLLIRLQNSSNSPTPFAWSYALGLCAKKGLWLLYNELYRIGFGPNSFGFESVVPDPLRRKVAEHPSFSNLLAIYFGYRSHDTLYPIGDLDHYSSFKPDETWLSSFMHAVEKDLTSLELHLLKPMLGALALSTLISAADKLFEKEFYPLLILIIENSCLKSNQEWLGSTLVKIQQLDAYYLREVIDLDKVVRQRLYWVSKETD